MLQQLKNTDLRPKNTLFHPPHHHHHHHRRRRYLQNLHLFLPFVLFALDCMPLHILKIIYLQLIQILPERPEQYRNITLILTRH